MDNAWSLAEPEEAGSERGSRMRTRRGFTLIELLVVIAIIALLMAILMPALSKARDQARTLRCRANLKQYGIGLRMYLDDNSYKFPDAWTWLKSEGHDWVRKGERPEGVLWPYLKELDVHMCPKFNMLAKGTDYADTAVSYVMNSYVGRGGEIWSSWLGTGVTGVSKETEVYQPSQVIVFTEENTWIIEGYSIAPSMTRISPWATPRGRSTTMRRFTTRRVTLIEAAPTSSLSTATSSCCGVWTIWTPDSDWPGRRKTSRTRCNFWRRAPD